MGEFNDLIIETLNRLSEGKPSIFQDIYRAGLKLLKSASDDEFDAIAIGTINAAYKAATGKGVVEIARCLNKGDSSFIKKEGADILSSDDGIASEIKDCNPELELYFASLSKDKTKQYYGIKTLFERAEKDTHEGYVTQDRREYFNPDSAPYFLN